jgi:hypothetical protein
MGTTAIIAVIVNLIISVIGTIDSTREIKKSPVLSAYYEAQGGKVVTIISWMLTIIFSLVIYGLILYGTGFWNTLGWVLIVLDTITTIGFSVILRFIRIKLSKEEG